MSISKISVLFCERMNKISPKSQEENKIIQYGMELMLDNVVKFLFILLVGFIIGKGLETIAVLSAFCGLRLQAGGIHARTGVGCGLSMFLIWGTSIIGSTFFNINTYFLPLIYLVSLFVIIILAPRTINIEHFSFKDIINKKIKSIFVLTLIMLIAYFCIDLRELLIYPVVLEVLTLLPKNKAYKEGENKA